MPPLDWALACGQFQKLVDTTTERLQATKRPQASAPSKPPPGPVEQSAPKQPKPAKPTPKVSGAAPAVGKAQKKSKAKSLPDEETATPSSTIRPRSAEGHGGPVSREEPPAGSRAEPTSPNPAKKSGRAEAGAVPPASGAVGTPAKRGNKKRAEKASPRAIPSELAPRPLLRKPSQSISARSSGMRRGCLVALHVVAMVQYRRG